ncbi:Ultraviolet-B receptor UVR8 [Apostasia shenzhenica]|uniref:Ultraviolet-B receptor UVR8 n=1 Tax=Apostasia shenzhenica TaxID=1088818 RepID=A0A2I0BBB4_9ASPA|nr:Ultraviolet-B receptor UVR8 [Apostasia shenzhenica]
MNLRSSNGDVSRLSISSAPSCSSQGSGPDDIDSLGDVYMWGEVWGDCISSDGQSNSCSKMDVLLPKPLESNVVLDVHHIACGFRHAALVTRQGEIFSWGEESGGMLGDRADSDLSRPRLVESLALCNVDSVACGEYHTCAITNAGDLFTWGDGTQNTGLLGHGTNASHWIPKRVSGSLEGIQVLSVACSTWHSALATSSGRIYTFGDGTFGVLGHGNRKSVAYPKEIESLSGLRTIKVACGVWHTAAIVEVMGTRKLFTWGDGDKHRLGQGDKDAKLIPTCVPSLIEYNFHQLACGQDITVALTTSGHVFTMGSSMHGQLGYPQSDGKIPCLVQDRLVGELVEEIACGSHHVAVLTSRSEVYTWGRGDNGRLGHGDTDDRKTPSLVEALKDRHVKSISCGSNFTACICIHKWVSGVDQSVCTGCRQPFGFTRKRHNCYNCGLVFCHSCSSRKVLKAALAPTPGKPHRVCDSCYSKLKAAEADRSSAVNRKNVVSRTSFDSGDVRRSRLLLAPAEKPIRPYDVRYSRNDQSSNRTSQASSSQFKEISVPSLWGAALIWPITSPKPPPPPPPSVASFNSLNPHAGKPIPSQFSAPDFSGIIFERLKKTNEQMDREILKLKGQVKNLKQKLEHQDTAVRKALKKAEDAACVAADESTNFNNAVELIKAIEVQLKNMAEKLPPDLGNNFKALVNLSELFLNNNKTRLAKLPKSAIIIKEATDMIANQRDEIYYTTEGGDQINGTSTNSCISEDINEAAYPKSIDNGTRSPGASLKALNSHGEAQVTEQFEPGVYLTLLRQRDGSEVFKGIKFSKKRFAEQQAEDWWRENQERVLKKYNLLGHSGLHMPSTSTRKTKSGLTN